MLLPMKTTKIIIKKKFKKEKFILSLKTIFGGFI